MAEDSSIQDESESEDSSKKSSSIEELPPGGEEVLSILEDYVKLDKSSLLRWLDMKPEDLDKCIDELEKGGWVNVRDRELGEYRVEITKKAVSSINELKEIRKSDESEQEVKTKPSLGLKDILGKLRKIPSRFRSLITSNIVDITLIVSFFIAFQLVREFAYDPNQRTLNLFIALLLFSVILVVYRSSKDRLRTKSFMDRLEEFIGIMMGQANIILFSTLMILLIYFAGWYIIYPAHRVLTVLLCAIVLTTVVQLYHPLESWFKIIKFYLGSIMIVYSLLLIFGFATVISILFQAQSRMLDALLGITLLALVYVNRVFLGVKTFYLRNLIMKEVKKK
jgi:hypothetical protein